ncbi:MAG: hypothetical protein ACRD01_09825 [Terriglobales bacterium]
MLLTHAAIMWLALALAPAPQAATPSVQRAHQEIAAAITALGGSAYLQTSEWSGRGHLYSFNSNGQLANPGTEFWEYFRFPADERLELTKKRNVIYIHSQGKGWQITFKGVAPMPQSDLAAYAKLGQHSLDVILKTWAQQPSTLMLDQGVSNFDQEQVESVSFTTSDGDSATVDLDLVTHLPTRVHWRRNDALTGGHYEESVVYGNWASIQGAFGKVEMPFSLAHFEGGQKTDQRYFDALSLQPFADAYFDPHAKIRH